MLIFGILGMSFSSLGQYVVPTHLILDYDSERGFFWNDLGEIEKMKKADLRQFLQELTLTYYEREILIEELRQTAADSELLFNQTSDRMGEDLENLKQQKTLVASEVEERQIQNDQMESELTLLKKLQKISLEQVQDIQGPLEQVAVTQEPFVNEFDSAWAKEATEDVRRHPNHWTTVVNASKFPSDASMKLVMVAVYASPSCASSSGMAFPRIYHLDELKAPQILKKQELHLADFICNECSELEILTPPEDLGVNFLEVKDFLAIEIQTIGDKMLIFNPGSSREQEFLFSSFSGGTQNRGAGDGVFQFLDLVNGESNKLSLELRWIDGELYAAFIRDDLEKLGVKYDFGGIAAGDMCTDHDHSTSRGIRSTTPSIQVSDNCKWGTYFCNDRGGWKMPSNMELRKPRLVFRSRIDDMPDAFLEPEVLFYKLELISN